MTLAAGKTRYIGSAYPGAERWAQIVAEKFSLSTMRGMAPADFLAKAERWGSQEAYQRWLRAYQTNSGTFLDHIVWGADRALGPGPDGRQRYLYGAMDDRYATNAQRVFVPGGLDVERDVKGKRALVVGCWDGTENLLLRALGASWVDGVEEVAAFAEQARLQMDAWQVPYAMVWPRSLYEVDIRELWQSYDLLYVPGVMYHLTDLAAALVICWAMLKPGGKLAFESIVDPPDAAGRPLARYLGASVAGWNWWAPTPRTYEQLLRDCGFPDGRTVETSKGRGWWAGTKAEGLPALTGGAAGFSRPDLLRAIVEMQGKDRCGR